MLLALFVLMATSSSPQDLDWSRDPLAQLQATSAGAGSTVIATPSAAPVPPFECRPEVIAAFREIWKRAGHGAQEYEAAFRADRAGDVHDIVYMEMTREPYRLPVLYDRRLSVAIAHTHPDSAAPTPGPGDYAAAVPNYVVSRRALYVTIPGTRTHRLVRREWDAPCK
jgi:hypothetical protein